MHRPLFQYAILCLSLVLLAVGCFLSLGQGAADYFMPHSHCYLFNKDLMLLHGGSDMLIGLAYVAISATLVWLVFRARRDLPFHWMMLAFATFIIACGATHFMEVWTLNAVNPRYWLSGWVKLVTAIASVTTALVLPPLVPRILSLMEAARFSAENREKLELAYEELNELYSKVKQMDQIKTHFFANVSHELRTPLALIFSPVERLLQSCPDPAMRHELTVVRRNALLLYKYVNDLLDVSKLEAGKLELQYSRLDMAAMARVMANIFESVVSERGIQVVVQTPDESLAEVDGGKVQRVFMNLLSNAFKYAPNDSTVKLTLTEDGDHLTLTVEDAGPGIPPELREGIFERFQQGDKETQRRFGGTGLGLSIVKEFVVMHGGTITVGESAAGGAQFRVRLPRRAPDGVVIENSPWVATDEVLKRLANAPATAKMTAAVLAEEAVEDSRPDVLVVEDNNDMRDFICRVLTPEVRTRAARDGVAALEAVKERVPDLIITDMMMPRMTGEELVTRLRQDERLRDVPVILLTAKADEEMKLNLLIEGVQDYVMKPFLIDELRARVRNQVQTKLTRDALREAVNSRSEDLALMVRELSAAKSAAETANAAKDDFLAVLSHELRTPLTPALASASALMTTPARDADELHESLAVICRNIELEARLVDDLLDVTRITRGKLRIHSVPVDLHRLLRDAMAMVEGVLREKKIMASLELMPGQPLVRGDVVRLAQVFSNLLNNAAKFTPEGGHVKIRTALADTRVKIEVEDDGLGIAAEMLPRIFEPFLQGSTGTTRRFGGLGLGLSVAKGLVEAHAGTIRVRSAGYNQGAIFTLELPMMTDGSVVAEDHVESRRGAVAAAKPLRVLLVEDHEDTRQILNRLMTRWGHNVTTAGTVAQARAALAEGTFDLLLSDLGLPDGSGLEVVRALRQTSSIPAVAMSGYGMAADVARALGAGFTQHLVKPVHAEMLVELLEKYGEGE
jgi:signal transduction histidine kinase